MNLDQQVTSLELSKRLKELGCKQESIFVWEYYSDQCYGVKFIPYAVVPDSFNKYQLYPAYTASELGEILKPIKIPMGTFIGDECHMSLEISVTLKGCELIHHYEAGFSQGEKLIYSYYDHNEANARAKMLIHLIEQGLIKNENENIY